MVFDAGDDLLGEPNGHGLCFSSDEHQRMAETRRKSRCF
jgi:hypothetical protein